MNIEKEYNLHSIIAGLKTEYLEVFCKKCGEKISRLDFYGIDSKGVRLMARCESCNDTSIFKLKTNPPLAPLYSSMERNTDYRKQVRRKFRKHPRAV